MKISNISPEINVNKESIVGEVNISLNELFNLSG